MALGGRARGFNRFQHVFAPFAAALLFVLSLAASRPARAQVIDFAYHPPDALTYSERLTYTQVKDPGTDKESVTTTESKTRYDVKKTATGYDLKITPIIMASFRDGQRIANPMSMALNQAELTYKLDPEGRVKEIAGIEKFLEELKAKTPPASWSALQAFLNPTALTTRQINEWNGRIGNFIGRKGAIGEGWGSIEEFPLPTGERLKFLSGTKIEERKQRGPRIVVKLLFNFTTDADEMTKFLGKAMDLPTAKGTAIPEISEIKVEGGGERIVDPSTLLIYSETVGREIKLKMRAPGKDEPVETTLVERREYKYDYEP